MPDAVTVSDLGKCYRLYDRAGDRLKELLSPTRRAYHREKWALRGVSFSVEQGQVLGIVGHNGAGKSTLLRMLAGRLRPTEGTVQVKGQLSSILELGTGLNPLLTGRENARINALFMGLDPWRIEGKLDSILAFAELGEYADQRLETYSLGMKARLAFAVLTSLEPEVLLLDEALSAGDAGFSRKCTHFIRGLCRSGCTTIVVSHDLAFMIEACERVLWIDHGRLVASGEPHEVVGRYLDSLGQTSDLRPRPRQLLLRVRPVGDHDGTVALHHLEWLDEAGQAVDKVFFGGNIDELLSRTAEQGFGGPALRRQWGEPEKRHNYDMPFRLLRPRDGHGGAGHLVVPVPDRPRPLPVAMKIYADHAAVGALELSVFVDGAFVEVGRLGGAAPKSEHALWTPALPVEWLRAAAAAEAGPALARAPGRQ